MNITSICTGKQQYLRGSLYCDILFVAVAWDPVAVRYACTMCGIWGNERPVIQPDPPTEENSKSAKDIFTSVLEDI